jgi:hypothetical protein
MTRHAPRTSLIARESSTVEFAIRRCWSPIQRLRFFAALKKTAIDQNSRLLGLNDVTGTGYFAASCANEGDFHVMMSW